MCPILAKRLSNKEGVEQCSALHRKDYTGSCYVRNMNTFSPTSGNILTCFTCKHHVDERVLFITT